MADHLNSCKGFSGFGMSLSYLPNKILSTPMSDPCWVVVQNRFQRFYLLLPELLSLQGNEWIQEKSSEMKLVNAIRTAKTAALSRPHLCGSMRSIFSSKTPDASKQSSSFESADEFERRIFGGALDADSKNESFFDKLDRVGMARGRPDSKVNDGFLNRFDTLSDGMDVKLKKAATFFGMTDEVKEDDSSYRPDVKFRPGMTYNLRDLDLTKPAAQKPFKRPEFERTTKEVLRKTDFRNVRFLANVLTEAGLIIKRSKTKISAKAQRKVARETKTARALGLLPFTTMGTKHFQFGKSMEDFDEDFDLDGFYGPRVNNFFVDEKS